jgi:hypothetical protein
MSEAMSSNPMGYTNPVRSAKFSTGVNKIMTRFGSGITTGDFAGNFLGELPGQS